MEENKDLELERKQFEEKQKLIEKANNIKMYVIQSSNVNGLGYDENNKILRVQFKNGGQYLYTNVEQQLWEKLKKAPSKGKTLYAEVLSKKEKYKYYKM